MKASAVSGSAERSAADRIAEQQGIIESSTPLGLNAERSRSVEMVNDLPDRIEQTG